MSIPVRKPITGPNPLEALPPRARKYAYTGYGLAALATGSAQVGYSAADLGQPVWLTVAVAVVSFLAVPFSALAATHVQAQPAAAPPAAE